MDSVLLELFFFLKEFTLPLALTADFPTGIIAWTFGQQWMSFHRKRLSCPQDCSSPVFSCIMLLLAQWFWDLLLLDWFFYKKKKKVIKKWTFPSSPTKPRSQKQSRQFVILDCMWQEENIGLNFQREPLWTWKGCREVIWFSHKVLQPSEERRVSFWCGKCQAPGREKLLRQRQLALIPTSIPKAKAMASARLKKEFWCRLPLEQLPCEGVDGRWGGGWKKYFLKWKTIEKEKASEASCWQNLGFCGNPRLWGAVSLSERFLQEKSKSLIFTSSRLVNVGSVETYW